MTKARDLAGFASSSVTTTASDGLVLKGDGSTTDVIIKNGANATVASVADGTTGVTFAGTPTFPDGSINIADLDIDGGTDIGAALVDADLMVVDDGAGGTNRKATMSRLATYMGTKIGGGLEFISSTDVSNAATASFTGFDSSKYDSYLFTAANIIPATDNKIFCMRMSVDGGSNYLSASDSYNTSGSNGSIGTGDAAFLPLAYYGIGNVAATEGLSGNFTINGPQLNARTYVTSVIQMTRDAVSFGTDIQDEAAGGGTKVATVVNAVQFLFDSGNITSGTITMYGLVNA